MLGFIPSYMLKVVDTHDKMGGCYDVAMRFGAWAGKVSGAGGGGFMMLMTDPENCYHLIRALNEASGTAGTAKLTFDGAEGWPVTNGAMA